MQTQQFATRLPACHSQHAKQALEACNLSGWQGLASPTTVASDSDGMRDALCAGCRYLCSLYIDPWCKTTKHCQTKTQTRPHTSRPRSNSTTKEQSLTPLKWQVRPRFLQNNRAQQDSMQAGGHCAWGCAATAPSMHHRNAFQLRVPQRSCGAGKT
jgi:hypothetical protein